MDVATFKFGPFKKVVTNAWRTEEVTILYKVFDKYLPTSTSRVEKGSLEEYVKKETRWKLEEVITRHWGMWISSKEPVTGVINNNNVEWLWEEVDDGIDLDYHNATEGLSEEEIDSLTDNWEQGTTLIGNWKEVDGRFVPGTEGEYAAIYNPDTNTTQVIWSKYTKRCALCSPCYPGQGDLDSEVCTWPLLSLLM